MGRRRRKAQPRPVMLIPNTRLLLCAHSLVLPSLASACRLRRFVPSEQLGLHLFRLPAYSVKGARLRTSFELKIRGIVSRQPVLAAER
jgi:hypothetical protein